MFGVCQNVRIVFFILGSSSCVIAHAKECARGIPYWFSAGQHPNSINLRISLWTCLTQSSMREILDVGILEPNGANPITVKKMLCSF